MGKRKERVQQRIKFNNSEKHDANDLYLHIVQMFGCIEKTTTEYETKLQILKDVEVEISLESILIEWTKDSVISETIADSIVMMILGLKTNKESALSELKLKEREDDAWKIRELQNLFQEQFGDCFSVDEGVEEQQDAKNGTVTIGKSKAIIDFSTMKLLDCNSNPLKGRVESILSIGQTLTTPLC